VKGIVAMWAFLNGVLDLARLMIQANPTLAVAALTMGVVGAMQIFAAIVADGIRSRIRGR
jgi:hypothetical protein